MAQRTGIPTIRFLLSKICKLISAYSTVMKVIVPPEKHVYIDAVMLACENFLENIPHPSLGD